MSQGFADAGYSIVGAFDNWEPAARCYRDNLCHPFFEHDLSDTEYACDVIADCEPDLIAGGPPCQDFSSAGARREGERANLTTTYAEIVADIQPTWAVMENVPPIQKSAAGMYAKSILTRAGYSLCEVILDASKFGIPQKRRRYFCIASNQFDAASDLETFFADTQTDKSLTVLEALGNEVPVEHYYRHPRSYQRRAVFAVTEPSPTVRGVNRHPSPNYRQHPNDTAPIDQVRALTAYERSRIQSFPPEWKWPDAPKTHTEQMIGNAVPPRLACVVANAISHCAQ